jgi:hypothetical protein
MVLNQHAVQSVGGAERRAIFFHIFRSFFAAPFSLLSASQNGPRRQGSASPRLTTGTPLTAPGRSEQHLLRREKGSLQQAAGDLGAKMAPFFTATDIQSKQR